MSSSSMRSIGGWKTTGARVKLIAVVAVLLMVFSSAICIVGSAEDGSATVQNTKDTAYQTTIVYEPGTPGETPSENYNFITAPGDREVTYSGNVISTEYNPQVWDFGSETNGSYWYKIKSYSQGNTIVFIGWQYQTGVDSTGEKIWTSATYDPGDVLVYENSTWYADYTSTSKTALYLTDGKIHVKAAWGTVNASSNTTTNFSGSGGSKYTNFYLPTSNVSSFSGASNCTVRPGISNSGTGSVYDITITMPTANFYDVAIDSTSIYIRYTIYNWHGDYGQGIWANGKTLIFGDGIKCNFNSNLEGSYSYQVGAVYGGSQSNSVSATKLIFHSGIYSDIVGGGSSVTGDTYIVINGATVTDTLLGACHSSNSTGGDAWVFATGLKMYGDYYTEQALDSNFEGVKSSDGYSLKAYESSVFTGGSNNGSVQNTHVYLSGDSSVWDLQAGGRRGHSTVTGTAEVDVSGKAQVRHALCGSITDGADGHSGSSGNSQSVKTVKLYIRGDAKVASVFGAGYDTSYVATYSSMYGSDSSILIDISGGTVGYVYGGGYRGTIGYRYTSDTSGSADAIDSITINISGGEILYDVFGGGRGGVDKVCHTITGGIDWSDAYKDFTGKSEVYADNITINMTGGTVDGNIYGGGESVPWLDGYTSGNDVTSRYNVASVHATVAVNISGGTVAKCVYGGGKGIDADDTSVKYVPKILALKSTGDYYEVNWLSQTTYKDDYTLRSDTAKSVYATYARVYGDIAMNISGTEEKIAAVGENVYGGGAIGLVGSSGNDYLITVDIQKYGSVTGSVYGAGKGTSTSDSLGQVNGGATVTVGGTVSGNVYGGGAYGQVTGDTSVSVSGTVGIIGSETNGNIFGGGQGLASSLTLGKVGGKTVVDISGTAKGNVYGGGAYGQVTGSTDVTVTGTVGTEGGSYGNVFGAGQGSLDGVGADVGKVGSVVEVLIDGNGLVYGNVYGGGAYGNISEGDTKVTVNSNAAVKGSVYGGGQGASAGETWAIDSSSTDSKKILTQIYADSAGKSVTNTYVLQKDSEPSHSGYSEKSVNGVTVYYKQLDTEGKQYSFVMVYNGAYIEGSSVTYSDSASFDKVLQKLSDGMKVSGGSISYASSGSTSSSTITQTYDSPSASGTTTITVTSYSNRNTANTAYSNAGSGYTEYATGDYAAKYSDDGTFLKFVMKYVVSGNSKPKYVITCTDSGFYRSNESIGGVIDKFEAAITSVTSSNRANTIASTYVNSPLPASGSIPGSLDEISNAIVPSSSGGNYGYVPGSANVTIDGKVEKNVYGGGAFGAIGGSTTVSVSGTVGTNGSEADGNVYGGGQGLATSVDLGKVNGSSVVTISGTAKGNVYGGGAYGQVAGSTDVTVSGNIGTKDSEYGNVYGAGQGVASGDPTIGQVASVTKVLIKNGANVYNSVYGGGAHGNVTSTSKLPVTVESGATVYKNVFGGGYGNSETYSENDGNIAGSTEVTIAGTVEGNVYGGGGYGVVNGTTSVSVNGTVNGIVYGGGFGFQGKKSNLSATVTITGGNVGGNVYGGAQNGMSEGNTSVTMTSAKIGGTVYGGGLGVANVTSVTGTSLVTDTSSEITGSVYGAAENGIVGSEGVVDLTSSVTLDSTKVSENVFGGGVGALDVVSVYGKTSVVLGGTTEVGGNVYGAAENGFVTSSLVTITSGTVKGDVYGAGLGAAYGGKIYVSVTGNVTVTMSGGTVEGLFYGGAAYGQVQGAITVTLSGGIIENTVYAGGKGTTNYVSVNGSRKIHLCGTKINGSLYGGSALGTDANKDNKEARDSDAYVYIESGYVKGSVFGGGFQGLTYGSTYISIGKYAQASSLPMAPSTSFTSATSGNTEITIGESIYLGGDVGVVEAGKIAYTTTMVFNASDRPCQMSIDGTAATGETVTISISGSIMGSGNSCNTDGKTNIHILGFKPASGIESVHRVTDLTIEDSIFSMSGRATVDEHSSKHIMDSMYALYKIGNLVLKNGSTITLNASMENVGAYSSLNANGDATQKYTPLNKIVIGGGNVLAFRQIITSGTVDEITYSKVIGYTIVTVSGEDGTDFGGYILGSTTSTGGFMVYHEGSFKAANYYDAIDAGKTDGTRCWYLAGTITQEVTVTVGTDGAEAIVSLPRLQAGTQYRYTGGTYITGAPLKGYKMISDGTYTEANQFSVLFGYGNTSVQDIVLFGTVDSGACEGTYLGDYTKGVTPVLGTGDARNSIMYVKVAGNFTGAEYVGYVLVYINECRAVTYSEGGEEKTMYVVVNTVQTKINIYSNVGSTTDSVDLSIGTVDGNGTGQLLIESGYPGREVSVVSVTPDSGNVSGNVTKLYLESSKNADNTLGWTDSKGEIPYYINGTVKTGSVGTLQGGYQSTLLFSVRDFGGTAEEKYEVVLRISDGTVAGTFERKIIVHIEPVPDVNITFNGIKQGDSTLSLTYSFHYGITISEEDCPPGGDNFVGWYTDKDYNNPFSYSTPLTQDLELYALYMYTVTFDHMDGTTSVLYVSMNVGIIGSVENPVREGYDFIGWFTSTSFATKWDLATQKVTGDMTLYAYWVGKSVTVTFWYPDTTSATGKTQLETKGTMTFGDMFNVKITTSGTDKKYLLTVAQNELEEKLTNVKFIYWVYKMQYDSKDDKSYAVYTSSYLNDWKMVEQATDASGNVTYSVALCANLSDVAVKIVMDPKIYDETTHTSMDLNAVIDPPSEFLAFPYETGTETDYKTFKMKIQLNGATRPGYNLEGWSLDMDSSRFISGNDYIFLTGGDITITLAALSGYDGFPYSATFTISQNGSAQNVVQVKLTQEEYYLINPSARPSTSTTSTTDPFTFSFKSHWEHIPYTVTIADMENGTIKAFYEGASGNYVYFTTGTFYYGQKFNLIYSANDGYQFSKWKSTGEGVFEDTASAQTTYVVQSDGVISAYAVGPQIVSLMIQFESTADWVGEDGKIDRTKIPKLALSSDGTTIDSYVTAQAVEHTSGSTTYTVTFSGTANLGLHHVALCGSDGTLYDLGFQVESTTKTNVYYITATAPTGVAADHVYLGKVIYVENAITDKEKGLKSLTEFLLQYTYSDGRGLKNDAVITMVLNVGYFIYKDVAGTTIVSSTDSEATYEWKNVSVATKLEGEISHTKHNLTVNYVYGSETLKTETGSVGYGELYWDVLGNLPTEITRTESGVEVKYSVTSWVIGNSSSTEYINSSAVCNVNTFNTGITITANLEKQGDNYIDLHVMQQDTDGSSYTEKLNVRVYADSSKNLEYQMLVYDGFDCTNVKIDEAETTLGSAGLVKLTWTENKDVHVYLDRYTVTVKLYEYKEGETAKTIELREIRYGGYLNLPNMPDTDERAYGSWAVGGKLSGTVRDGVYSATLEDVLEYLKADDASKENDFYLSISYTTPTFSVTFVTPYGKITQNNGTATQQENTMFDVELVKGTEITNDGNVLKYTVGGVTYSYSVSEVTGYTFGGWDPVTSGTYAVNSDVIITAKWEPQKYTVNIYYDGYETKYTGDSTVKDITATVGSGAVTLENLSEVTKTWTFGEVEYTYKLGKQFSTQVEYGSWVTIAVEFESKWSLDTDKLKVTNSGMTYAKGSDLQHYTVSMFANGDGDTIEIYLTSMYSGATIFWNLIYTDESGQKKDVNVLSNTDAQIGEAYFQKFFENDAQAIKDLPDGYYYDGWYYNGQGLEVKQESGDWGYNVSSVPNSNIYIYAYAYKVKVNGIDDIYDGTAHSVTVDIPKSDFAGKTISSTVSYTYESEAYTEISITNVTDVLNNKTYDYTVTITKAHNKLDGTGTYETKQVLEGTVGVYLKPNVVYLVVDNSLAAKSTIPTTDAEYKAWLAGKETYTILGLVEGETLEVTGWSGPAVSKINDYGVYDLIPTYKLTYTVGTETTVITNETDNPPITVKVIGGFITVNKTGYSSIIA